MAAPVVTFFVRYDYLSEDGKSRPLEIGPINDEALAVASFDDLTAGTDPPVRNARVVRSEETIIRTQGG